MMSFSSDTQADVIESFNSTSRNLDDLLTIDIPYFECFVKLILPGCVSTKLTLLIHWPRFQIYIHQF